MSRSPSIMIFLLLTGFIMIAIALALPKEQKEMWYSDAYQKALIRLIVKTEEPHLITISVLDYLYADDGKPVLYPCRKCR